MVKINPKNDIIAPDGVKKANGATKPSEPISIMGDKIIPNDNLGVEITAASPQSDIASLGDFQGKLAANENLLKEMGCPALKTVAGSASFKGKAVIDGVCNAIKGFDKDIDAIMQNNSMSEEDKEKKISLINAKKQAVITESEAKMQALVKISDCLLDLLPVFLKLQEMGVGASDFTSMLQDLVMSVSPSPSNFSKAKDEKEIQKSLKDNMKNIFGKGSAGKLEKFIGVLDRKIQAANEKAAKTDVDPKEKEQAITESKAYNIQKKLFMEFFQQFEKIEADE